MLFMFCFLLDCFLFFCKKKHLRKGSVSVSVSWIKRKSSGAFLKSFFYMDCFQPECDITRHEIIEILLIQKNAIRQRLKALHLILKINVLPSIF